MRILMIGDVIGRPGRRAVRDQLGKLRRELQLDLIIANGENAAGGRGLTPPTAAELFESGVDILTSGNHIWDQKEIIPLLDTEECLLRPLNYPPGLPGRGYLIYRNVLIVNLIGRTFMGSFDCPFRAIDALFEKLPDRPKVVFVDFHAEATSEKQAMGWYLNGRASAVVGTHTHVPTADARVLSGGTAVVSDVGMVGPVNSIIGDDVQAVLQRFLLQVPNRLPVADGPVVFNAVLVEVDECDGKAVSVMRVDREIE